MADAGVPLHVLRIVAGYGSLLSAQRYLRPDLQALTRAGHSFRAHLSGAPTASKTLAATLRAL
ncbi:hypothetical protein GCM10010400_12570 [Streptomyces aculeolatus]